ncbi:MAG TPA: hypothetical protein VEJ38_16710 [Candidatus Acidoferrales bacterium]|nr:hypothetical protein [Candidatus Acidoferrales bacterium]
MARTLACLFALLILCSFSARAQGLGDKLELYGGYSYIHIDNSPSFGTSGWDLAGEYKFADWIGGVIDIDGNYSSGNALHTVLFGLQVSWPARVSPFGHVLIGVAHGDSGPFTDNSFAAAIGGGLDARLVPHVYWRIFEGDYLSTHAFGVHQNNARISTGIVIHF